MPLGLIELIVIQIGLNLLSRALEPKRPRPKPAPFEAPTASSGNPLSRGMGVYECQPTITYVKGLVEQDTQSGCGAPSGQEVDIVRYYMKAQLVFGWEAHVLYDIVADERSLRTQIPGRCQSIDGNNPAIITPALPFDFRPTLLARQFFAIHARMMFGGGTEGGGLEGTMAFYPGRFTPELDELIAEVYGDRASRYPWHCHAVLGRETDYPDGENFYVSANQPAPRPMSAILGYYPNALLGGNGQIGIAGNWVEMAYDYLTNQRWGARSPTSRYDIAQWQEQAQAAKDLGIGLAVPQDAPKTAADVIEDILTHMDAGIVEDPETGLLQIKPARADYDFDDLLVVNKSNSEDFKRLKPVPAKTLNDIQIRYRRFFGGVSGEVTTEVATNNYHYNTFYGGGYAFGYKTAGDTVEIGSVHVYSDGNELTEGASGADYFFDYNKGLLYVYNNPFGDVGDGNTITISYVSNPTYVAFVDDVVTVQNLASVRNVGRQQPESFDYTYFIDALSAQWKADRLRATITRSIDRFSWTAKRDHSHLTPWDVVLLNEPDYDAVNIPVRITRISGGTRTNPKITIEGIKDVWGEQILFTRPDFSVGNPGITPTAPIPVVACGEGGTGVARIAIFPSDSIFAVEVYEATDAVGTGSTLVATIAAGTDPMFYDGDPTKWYAVRQIHPQYNPSPLTPWIQCEDTDVIVDPECVEPSIGFAYDASIPLVSLTIVDPQTRVQSVEFNVRSASGVWSGWTEDTAAPYEATGEIGGRIEWRVTFINCDGIEDSSSGGIDLTPPIVEPPPETAALVTYLPVVLMAPGPLGMVKYDIEAERMPLTEGRSTEDIPPLQEATAVYLTAQIRSSSVNVGCYLSADMENPDSLDDWHPLQDESVDPTLIGPVIYIDPANLELLDANPNKASYNVKSEEVPLRLEANGIVRVRAAIGGGDGTGAVIISGMRLWFRFGPDSEVEETEDPPPENPGSCDVPNLLDNMTYANTGALDAAWPEA